MKAKTFEAQYELIEFDLYMDSDNSRKETISIVELVIKSNDIDFVKEEFNNTFIVEAENLSYVFSGYKLTECYEIGSGLIRAICIK